MKHWEIWSEGFKATGTSGEAFKMGEADGETFEAACRKFMETHPEAETYYNSARNTFWGCQLFPDEQSARKSFG